MVEKSKKINVSIRVRPLNQREIDENQRIAWQLDTEAQTIGQDDTKMHTFGTLQCISARCLTT